MFLETIAFVLLGTAVGIVLGMLPGMHINNVLPLILALSFVSPHSLAVFIASLSVTQIFVGYISSIFLGAPNEDTSLSVLPGHRLLLEGRGYEAIKLVAFGGICSLLLSLGIISILSNYFVSLYEISRPYIQYPILLVIIFMILSEKKFKKILCALLIVLLSGLLGIIVLGSSLVSQQNCMFPLLSGFFGISTLIISIKEKSKIPKQEEDDRMGISVLSFLKSVLLGSLAGILVGFLPAIGVSQAATMMQYLGGMREPRNFLVTLSSINTANELFSLSSLYLVGNPRSGSSVAIGRILPELELNEVLLLIGSICLASGIASIVTVYLGKRIPKFLVKINYTYLSLAVIVFMCIMIFVLTGFYGLLIAFTSASIGILCANFGVRRSNCMGCLLIPSLLFFSGLNPLVLSMLRL
jgi:putative membrane protein